MPPNYQSSFPAPVVRVTSAPSVTVPTGFFSIFAPPATMAKAEMMENLSFLMLGVAMLPIHIVALFAPKAMDKIVVSSLSSITCFNKCLAISICLVTCLRFHSSRCLGIRIIRMLWIVAFLSGSCFLFIVFCHLLSIAAATFFG